MSDDGRDLGGKPRDRAEGAAGMVGRGQARNRRVVTYTGFDLNHIERGRIVESWVNYDALALLQQLGLVPPVRGL